MNKFNYKRKQILKSERLLEDCSGVRDMRLRSAKPATA